MASIIVLLELEPSTEVLDAGEVDVGARVRWVHAAPADPDVPEDPGPRTFCGLDTTPLEQEQYRPAGPGSPGTRRSTGPAGAGSAWRRCGASESARRRGRRLGEPSATTARRTTVRADRCGHPSYPGGRPGRAPDGRADS